MKEDLEQRAEEVAENMQVSKTQAVIYLRKKEGTL